MASDASSRQQPKLTPASNAYFECEDGHIALNNSIAFLEFKIPLYADMLQFLSNSCISTALTKQPSAYYPKYLREFGIRLRESSLSTQVADTQHAEELVTTADATKGLDASESTKEQGNQTKTANAKKSCWHPDAFTTHILAHKRNMEDHTEQIPGEFLF
ncbi:hypothetical protein Tco_0908328 [Tanacetum coccineum]|uniref:Uncharacterized protein n=1 Tax=Tanacetum coccineum TaxID=301880 RepID=A0ABQ5CNZ3_9ASTR